MTDEMKPMEEKPSESSSQPYQPAEDYTPPSAEPPAGMTDTTPNEGLFAPPSIDASSFEGAQPVEPVKPIEPEFVQAQAPEPFIPAPAQPSGFPPVQAAPPAKAGVKWWVIVLIVLAVLCCCCVVIAAVVFANFEDWFGYSIDWSMRVFHLLA